MTDAHEETAVARLSALEVILPVGKPGAAKGRELPEMERVNGRTLIEWAVDEACQAGASRILMVAPKGYSAAPALACHLRQAVRTRRAADKERHPEWSVPRHPIPALLSCSADGPEGWDGLIRAAAARCRGTQALLLDPATALMAERRISTFGSFMLRRAAGDRGRIGEGAAPGHVPALLAVAELDWEETLSLPVLTGTPSHPIFAFDRPGTHPSLTVFAGRALIALPMPDPLPLAEPSALFPGEALTLALVAAGAETVRLLFRPADLRFPNPKPRVEPCPRGLPFASCTGLSALQHIA